MSGSLTETSSLAGASGQGGGYTIDQSLRFNYTSKLDFTPSSDGNKQVATLSFWLKNCGVSDSGSTDNTRIFMAGNSTSDIIFFQIMHTNPTLNINAYRSGPGNGYWNHDPKYRDPTGWQHFVMSYNQGALTTYVNGAVVPDTYTTTGSGWVGSVNTAFNSNGVVMRIGSATSSTSVADFYLAEYHWIDGTALDASSFGETNSVTNQWVPIEYAGSYGTNGFYLDFADSAALGDDSSGNGNDFTATNLAATDQTLDSPTNNFCTLNPLWVPPQAPAARGKLSEGNLSVSSPDTSSVGYNGATLGTISVASGKWYFEWYIGSANWPTVGIAKPDFTANYSGNGNGNRTYGDNGSLYGGSSSSTSTTYTTGDIIGCAVDMDNGKMWFSKNGTFIDSGNPAGGTNAQFTDLLSSSDMGSTGQVLPFFSDVNWATTDTVTFNAGQDSSFAGATTAQGNGGTGEDFYYTPPSGYKALNTDNLSAPAIALPTDHFNTVLYTGTGSSPRSITGVGFQPDFLWIKDRVGANNHVLTDVVRGSSPVYPGLLYSNSTIAEVNGASQVTSYDSDGFTMGATTYVNENGSSNTYVAWNWLAGGAAVSNTDGDITSSVSANPAAGFSIVSYTGVGTNAQSIGHGLTQTPEIIIVKNLDTVQDWTVMPGTSVLLGGSYYLELNNASDRISNGDMFSSYANSNVFYTGQNSQTNEDTKDIIAYCFHSVEGYSKVGSYTGNSNADGIFLYTGFKPSYVMIKCYDGGSNTQEWVIFDDARNTYNLTDKYLYANENAPDGTGGGRQVDFVSNGIKMRGNDGPTNKSNRSYIYLAFAESPFKYSNAR